MEKKNVDIHKAYKEKPYLNSNKQPFGHTLKGKTKEYIDAHIKIKGLLIKGKEIANSVGRMKILDTTNNRAMVNTIVEIESKEGIKGKAELSPATYFYSNTSGLVGKWLYDHYLKLMNNCVR